MAVSPEIKTRRLRITPFTEKHLTQRYVDWLNNKALMRFSEQRHKTHSMETCRKYWRSFEGTPHFFWAIETAVDGIGHIGNINAYLDSRNQLADIGILIGEPRAAGRGLGAEAWAGVSDYLFQSAGVRKLTAGTLANNVPMCNLARKSGMKSDGKREKHFLFEGRETDVVYFAMFRDNWRKLSESRD